MTSKGKFLQWFAPMAAVFVIGLAVATVWDLQINQAVVDPTAPWAIFMEAFGWIPAFVPGLVYAMLWAGSYGRYKGQMTLRSLGGLVLAGGSVLLFLQAYGYLEQRGYLQQGLLWKTGVGIVLLLGAVVFGLVKTWKLPEKTLGKLHQFAFFGTVYLLGNQLLVYALKTIWQRTRFDEMIATGSFTSFTPWYLPFGNGGSSMPSGHTANAAGILMLIFLCDVFSSWNKRRKLVYVGCWGFALAMGAARIVIGRHFLSDTLVACGLMALLLYGIRSNNWYKKRVWQVNHH